MKMQREYPRVTVTEKGTRWVEQGHPWIYEAEVLSLEGDCPNGALVDAVSEKGKYLGTGFLSRESKIRVRLLSRNANDRFDSAFWKRLIQYAWQYRKTVMPEDTDCCRLVFGEADGFPGLTVDRFHDLLVTQTLSVGVERLKETIFPLLVEVLREDGQEIRGLYERNDVAIRALEGLAQGKGWYPLVGLEQPGEPQTEIVENGIRYLVDVAEGQKTGFFLDQKYNRLGGTAGPGPTGAGLLYPHRVLCAERGSWRGRACDGGGCVRLRHPDGPAERGAQRSGRPDGLSGGGRVRPASPADSAGRQALRLYHSGPAGLYQVPQDREQRGAGVQGD